VFHVSKARCLPLKCPRAITPLRSRHEATVANATMALGAAMLVWSGVIDLNLRTAGHSGTPAIG
jgi:hypothetical protein